MDQKSFVKDVTIKFQVRKLFAFLEKNKTSIDVFGNFLAPSLAFLYISSPTYSLLLHEIVASQLAGIGENQTEKSSRQMAKVVVEFCPKCLSITLTGQLRISMRRQQRQQCVKFLLTFAVWLAHSGERWSAKREIAGSKPRSDPTLVLFKFLRSRCCLCNDICKRLDSLESSRI